MKLALLLGAAGLFAAQTAPGEIEIQSRHSV
jgi:hypothetical protein